MNNDLFRPEAMVAQQAGFLGEVVLIRPVSFTVFSVFAVAIAAIIVAFFIWGSYTKRSTVAGQLVPDTGLIKVYARQSGIVLQNRVVEGQAVKRGDVLFVLSRQRDNFFPVPTFILSGAPPKLTKGHSVSRKFIRAQPVPKSCPSCAQPENVGPASEEF